MPPPPTLFPCNPPPQDSKNPKQMSISTADNSRRLRPPFIRKVRNGRNRAEEASIILPTGAVVETASVARVSPAPAAICWGLNAQDESAGSPVQVKVTLLGKDEVVGATSTVNWAVEPADTVALDGDSANVKSNVALGDTMKVSGTECAIAFGSEPAAFRLNV